MNEISKILYIDNDNNKRIINDLIKAGYIVTFVKTIHDAKTKILLENFDLLITDVKTTDGDCLSFIDELTQSNEMEFIVISNTKEAENLLKILELDVKYFSKSVNIKKIITTIKKFSSKSNTYVRKEELIKFDQGFIYNTLKHSVYKKDGNKVDLTQQELNLFRALVMGRDNYCSHENLLESISAPTKFSTIDTLRTVIKRIRKKTYENIIESLVGIGYKINIPLIKDYNYSAFLDCTEKINKKILLAKENVENKRELCRCLESYGFDIETVGSLKEAKDSLEFTQFDYIILDVEFSDGDAAELIRNNKNMRLNKYIVLSNTEDIHYKEYLYFKGIIDYIEKNEDLTYIAYSIYQTILKIELNNTSNHILLIEESKKIINQIEDILIPRNYNVDVTSSSENVIKLLSHKSYSMIILDLELEDVKALDFLLILKRHINKSLPVIMLSGSKRSYSLVRECYVKGAVECLRKPIYAEEFILKIDQWNNYYKQVIEINSRQRLLNSYKNIVDKAMIISKANPKGIITYANDIFSEISGYTKAELIGQPHSIVRHPDTDKAIFRDIWNTISHEKKTWSGILKNRKKDGTSYILTVYIMPVLDEYNEIIEYIALRNDITNLNSFNNEN